MDAEKKPVVMPERHWKNLSEKSNYRLSEASENVVNL
jgi:hypothetical protein